MRVMNGRPHGGVLPYQLFWTSPPVARDIVRPHEMTRIRGHVQTHSAQPGELVQEFLGLHSATDDVIVDVAERFGFLKPPLDGHAADTARRRSEFYAWPAATRDTHSRRYGKMVHIETTDEWRSVSQRVSRLAAMDAWPTLPPAEFAQRVLDEMPELVSFEITARPEGRQSIDFKLDVEIDGYRMIAPFNRVQVYNSVRLDFSPTTPDRQRSRLLVGELRASFVSMALEAGGTAPYLDIEADGSLSPKLGPMSLLSALYLDFLAHLDSGTVWKHCPGEMCGSKLFPADDGRRRFCHDCGRRESNRLRQQKYRSRNRKPQHGG